MKLNMPNWKEFGVALCAQTDPELFFPVKFSNQVDIKRAKSICYQCEIRPICLEYAMADPELLGIWGGLSTQDRIKLRRKAS